MYDVIVWDVNKLQVCYVIIQGSQPMLRCDHWSKFFDRPVDYQTVEVNLVQLFFLYVGESYEMAGLY